MILKRHKDVGADKAPIKERIIMQYKTKSIEKHDLVRFAKRGAITYDEARQLIKECEENA